MIPDFKTPRFPNAAASAGAGRILRRSDPNPTPLSTHLGITYRKGPHSCTSCVFSFSLSQSQTTRCRPRYQTVASFRYWPPLLLPAFSTLFCCACIPRLLVFNAICMHSKLFSQFERRSCLRCMFRFSLSSSAAQVELEHNLKPWP